MKQTKTKTKRVVDFLKTEYTQMITNKTVFKQQCEGFKKGGNQCDYTFFETLQLLSLKPYKTVIGFLLIYE